MKKHSFRFIIAVTLVIFAVLINKNFVKAAVIMPAPEGFIYKTIYYTPVYAVPDITTTSVFSVDMGYPLDVIGILDTGYYQVKIANSIVYIPGVYVEAINSGPNNSSELAKLILSTVADAYGMILDSERDFITSFGVKDINNDGIPELFMGNGKEIYTVYNKRPVMIYYSETPVTFIYSKNNKAFAGSFSKDGKNLYETFTLNYSLLPWGQVQVIMPNLCGLNAGDFTEINYVYENTSEIKADLGDTLYSLYVAGNL